MNNNWIKSFGQSNMPQFRLFCFPYAGGGASIYKKWETVLPDSVELCALQLPGRENRIREKPIRDLGEMIHTFHESVFPLLECPFAFFGHSMGALIAYEYCLHLSHSYGLEPSHLFLSGRASPTLSKKRPAIHALRDDEFIGEIRRFGGTPCEVFENRELLALMLPILRSDFALIENHSPTEDHRLSCPITALGGDSDPDVEAIELEEWRNVTSGTFDKEIYEGGHFFLNDHYSAIVKKIFSKLKQTV